MSRSILSPGPPISPPISPQDPWLAPLAGYTDLAFRLLCREYGASVACTEMISAKGLVLGQGKRSGAGETLLATTKEDSPLVVQLFGAEAPFLSKAVTLLRERGYEWFDLNMGCSVPKVGKSGAGSAMLGDIPNALAAARAMLDAAGTGRVGFKLRLGRTAGEQVYLDLARRLEDLGAGWITLHPRYARQGFGGSAAWEHIGILSEALEIPVLASGDLFSPEDGARCLRETGAQGLMFARGALNNPAICGEFSALMRGAELEDHPDSPADKVERIILRHAGLVREHMPVYLNRQGIEAGLLKMRSFVPRYVRHFTGARALRQALTQCASWEMLEDLLANFFDKVKDTL